MLVPLRDLPHGFVELLSVESGSLLLRHSCGFTSRAVTKQGSGNFCPSLLSPPPRVARRGELLLLLLLSAQLKLRRSRITQNLSQPVVQIRCNCAELTLSLSVHVVGPPGDNFLHKTRSGQEAPSGLAFAETFAQFWAHFAGARGNVNAYVSSSRRAPAYNYFYREN